MTPENHAQLMSNIRQELIDIGAFASDQRNNRSYAHRPQEDRIIRREEQQLLNILRDMDNLHHQYQGAKGSSLASDMNAKRFDSSQQAPDNSAVTADNTARSVATNLGVDAPSVAQRTPSIDGNGGPSASLTAAADNAGAAAPQVGQGAVVEQRSTSQLRPQVEPTFSPTAVVAANDGKSGQAMTDAVDAGGRNSAAQFMPQANVVPNAANDGPSFAAASPAEQEPVRQSKQPRTVSVTLTPDDAGTGVARSQADTLVREAARADAAIVRAAANNGAVDATQAALHAYNELGHAGRIGKLLRVGGQKIPVVGVALAGGFAAYALYNAEQGYMKGLLSETHINAVRAALVPYVGTQAGSLVTGVAGEEAIDATLAAVGVPKEYRLGTLRDTIASGAQAALDAREFSARKASIPQPTVDAFVAALRNERGDTQDAALNDYFTARDLALLEGREGRVQSATSQARFGNLPRSHVSQEEVNERISDAARTYLAYGGNIDTAMAALSDDPARARLEGQIQDVLNLVPARNSKEAVYPSNSEHLERLRDLRTQREASSDATERDTLMSQMRTEAANYLGQGKDARDALFAYYRGAPFGISTQTVEQIQANADMLHAFDGADGSKRDGKISMVEIGQKLANMGVYTTRIDANRDGEASFQELQTVYRNPEAFKDRER